MNEAAAPTSAPRIRAVPLSPARIDFRRYARARRRRGLHPALRWTAGIIGTIVLLVCFSVSAGVIVTLTEPDVSVDGLVAGLVVSVVIGALLGAGLLYLTTGAYAQLVGAVLAFVLFTGGVAMLVIAPVLRQMNSREVAEYRASTTLTWCGMLAVLAAMALSAVFFRWTMRKDARRRLSRWALGAGAVYGVWLALTGISIMFVLLTVGAGGAESSDGDETSVVAAAVAVTGIAILSLAPGIIFTYHAISAAMGEGSSEFHLPAALPIALAFGVVLLLGHAIMRASTPVAAPMPLLHTLAGVLPGLGLVALALRGSPLSGSPLRGVTWRQVTMAAGVSMAIATVIAIYFELGGAFSVITVMLVRADAFAHATDGDAVSRVYENADLWLSRREQVFAALIVASVFAPVFEELGKSLAVRFTMRPDSSRAECFLLGAAAGAAFGFLESLLYGAGGVSEDAGAWAGWMLLRGGSTSLHVLCSGLAGVGWWYWTRARDHRAALALFAAAIGLHAGWNAFATLVESRIFLEELEDRALEIIVYTVIGVVSTAMIVVIPLVARRLRDRPPDVGSTPLATMAPWLG